MTTETQILETLTQDVVSHWKPDFGIKLWGGELMGSAQGPILHFRDAAQLAALILKPSLERAAAIYVTGGATIENGTLFDLADVKHPPTFEVMRRELGRLRLLRSLPALYRLARNVDHGGSIRDGGAQSRRSGSTADAIRFHYDVSNEFYELFLDERMVYSCGYFDGWHDDIDRAQKDKLDHICRKLRLAEGERFLDIGCGWGALLIHAATHYGVNGHGVTLSQRQFELARRRVKAAGLDDRITIELKRFEEVDGPFDKIASIGMFEHVGFAHHEDYFGKVHALLKPRGLYLHHAITRHALRDIKAFHAGSEEYNALRKYIFPGGELDWIGHSSTELEIANFEIHDTENLRLHYGRTCRLWAERLMERMDEAERMVGPEQARIWYAYLVGCALAFEKDWCNIFQTLASRRDEEQPGWSVPPTRRYIYPC